MSDDTQDKQLPASAKKLEKARAEGQVVRSKDLGHFLVLAAAVSILIVLTPVWLDKVSGLLSAGLRFDARAVVSPDVMAQRLSVWTASVLMLIIPLALCVGAASAAASVASGGWVMSFQVLSPKFDKFNPVSGIANLFSMQQLVDALKASAMGLILGAVGAFILWKRWPDLVNLLALPLPAAFHEVGQAIRSVVQTLLLVIAAFALLDWPLQKHMFAKRMKMSHQDQKDEFKQAEGNTEVKGRMKQMMRERARKRMMAAVPTADLVVMNPTHYAVALKYDEGAMGAPRVVAKGLDRVALKIRDIAMENKVPVLEAPPLARALYANTEVDSEVPMALYSAVAQVLAYVYQLKAAMSGQAPMPKQMPDLDVPKDLDPHHKSGVRA